MKPIYPFICCSYFLRLGIAAHYYSWRFMQHFLGLVGFLVFFIVIIFFPETSHPNKRGVDNLDPSLLPKWRPVILNPLQPFWLLRSPNLLVVVRILFSYNKSPILFFFVLRLWLALRFCSLILVCDIKNTLCRKYSVHVFFSIIDTARLYHCEFVQLKFPCSFG